MKKYELKLRKCSNIGFTWHIVRNCGRKFLWFMSIQKNSGEDTRLKIKIAFSLEGLES